MGQRLAQRIAEKLFAAAVAWLILIGCDRSHASAPTSVPSTKPTVASLVPAATDMIIAMGCGDQLVAISNYDEERSETQGLPRVGDYLSNDWEKLSQVRPKLMITQYDPGRKPPGLAQRAADLGIELVNVRIDRLNDVFQTMQQLGELLKQPEKSAAAVRKIREQMDRVKQRVAGQPRVRTLIVRDEGGDLVVGPGTYLDELLTIAGGENVLAGRNATPYPRIDRELLLSLAPDAIIQLQPGATPQQIEQAKQVWSSMPNLPAVKNSRVYRFTQTWALLPASEVGDLAQKFAEALHP